MTWRIEEEKREKREETTLLPTLKTLQFLLASSFLFFFQRNYAKNFNNDRNVLSPYNV